MNARRLEATGNCSALVGNNARLSVRGSTITNNQGYGVAMSGGLVSLIGSTVTGNLFDVLTDSRPNVRTSTCETSFGGPGAPPDT